MYSKSFLLLLLPLGLVWLKSSVTKIGGGKFIPFFAQTMAKLASNNPHSWFKSLVETIVIPNAKVFGPLIMWGEFITALCIVCGIVALIFAFEQKLALWVLLAGLLGGFVLNTLFYFGAGWTGVSTETLNLLMLLTEGIAIYFVIKSLISIGTI
ncbi:MAG: hypothetical protein A3D75_02645 [Candidatus Levybacteria bacterium RIFCSPHIGHO2_02_FULL_37_18]|nr:MAG: hypothetical protein A3D75_02645 [Candidatus Levybacteria bacterium RIFCSPHIGHO2_02_FULL_37_18]